MVEDESGNTSAISDDEAPATRHTEFSTDSENNLTCCILMLDILLKQLELQMVEKHTGIHTIVCENVCRLLKCMVTAARVGVGSHICSMKVILIYYLLWGVAFLYLRTYLISVSRMRLLWGVDHVAPTVDEAGPVHGTIEPDSAARRKLIADKYFLFYFLFLRRGMIEKIISSFSFSQQVLLT